MKTLILEDDIPVANMIQSLLKKYFSKVITEIDLAHVVKDAVEYTQQKNYDLFLFDINLGQQTSFEVLESIENTTAKLIFITGHEKYALQAIKNGAMDYILKPIDIQEFKTSIQKAVDVFQAIPKPLKQDMESLSKKQMQALQISDTTAIHFVKLQDIVYLSSEGPYTVIHLEKQANITSSKNLKQFEEKLSNSGFYRVHHSFIVNALKIKNINKTSGFTVTMSNNAQIDISSRKKEDFLNYLSEIIDI